MAEELLHLMRFTALFTRVEQSRVDANGKSFAAFFYSESSMGPHQSSIFWAAAARLHQTSSCIWNRSAEIAHILGTLVIVVVLLYEAACFFDFDFEWRLYPKLWLGAIPYSPLSPLPDKPTSFMPQNDSSTETPVWTELFFRLLFSMEMCNRHGPISCWWKQIFTSICFFKIVVQE